MANKWAHSTNNSNSKEAKARFDNTHGNNNSKVSAHIGRSEAHTHMEMNKLKSTLAEDKTGKWAQSRVFYAQTGN